MADDDKEMLVRAYGEKLPKGALDPEHKGVDCIFVTPNEVKDGSALLATLKHEGDWYVLKKRAGTLGWKMITSQLEEVPRINDAIQVFCIDKHLQNPLSFNGQIETIKKVCSDFEQVLVRLLRNESADKRDYKMKFPSSVVPVCTLDKSYPCLLWEGVSEWTDRNPLGRDQITILLAPSGSGKTRCMIDLGCKEICLYFVGKRESFVHTQGSRDIVCMVRHLQQLYDLGSSTTGSSEINTEVLECSMAAVITARLFVLHVLKRLHPDFKARDWVFFQLEYVASNDVFADLTRLLLENLVLAKNIATTLAFKSVIMELCGSTGERWQGLVMVDEAQEMNKMLIGGFAYEGNSHLERSLLNPFLVGLANLGLGKMIFLAGTGESLLGIEKTSGSLKRFQFDRIFRMPGFDSPHEMCVYARKFVDVRELNFDMIFYVLGGRRRFFVSALEKFMMQINPSTSTFLEYAYEVCITPGDQLIPKVIHSILDDVKKFLAMYKGGKLLRTLVLAFYYSGLPVLVKCEPTLMELLNCSLGEFVPNNEGLKKQVGIIVDMGNSELNDYGCIRISENLVTHAIFLNLPVEDHYDALLMNQLSPSGLGTVYEPLTCLGLRKFFEGIKGRRLNEISERFSFQREVDNVYTEEYELVIPATPFGVPLVQTVCLTYGLDHSRQRAAPFLHLGPDSLAGPDKVALLKGVKTGKILPVLFQDKTGQLNLAKAFDNVDVHRMYLHAKRTAQLEAALHKLKEWCQDGYMQLLMTTEEHDLQESLCKYEDDISKVPCSGVQPLRAVVDKHNITFFNSNEFNGLLGMMKRTQAAERILCQAKTQAGHDCPNRAKDSSSFCGRHTS